MAPDYVANLKAWNTKVTTLALAEKVRMMEEERSHYRFIYVAQALTYLENDEVDLNMITYPFPFDDKSNSLGARLIRWFDKESAQQQPSNSEVTRLGIFLTDAINKGRINVRVTDSSDNSLLMQVMHLVHTGVYCTVAYNLFVAVLQHSDVNHRCHQDHSTALTILCQCSSRVARNGRFKYFQLFKENGCDVTAVDCLGRTALHILAFAEDYECIKLLFAQELWGIDWLQRMKEDNRTFIDIIERNDIGYGNEVKAMISMCELWKIRCKTFTEANLVVHLIPVLADVVAQYLFHEPGELTEDDLVDIIGETQPMQIETESDEEQKAEEEEEEEEKEQQPAAPAPHIDMTIHFVNGLISHATMNNLAS